MANQKNLKKADQYNDENHNYLRYWDHRQYENQAEVIALQKLLAGKHFKLAVDVGGGYGRLSTVLSDYADKVVLAEPSSQQLDIAKDYLKDYPSIERKIMQADKLDFASGSVDLLAMIRVMHHLPDPTAELADIARVLSKNGYAIIEMANYAHFLNRIRLFIKGQKMPLTPVDIRSVEHRNKNEIPFVNHNPITVITQFNQAGLEIEKVLSVSNLRHRIFKTLLPSKCSTLTSSKQPGNSSKCSIVKVSSNAGLVVAPFTTAGSLGI